jgi:hypothetical protein
VDHLVVRRLVHVWWPRASRHVVERHVLARGVVVHRVLTGEARDHKELKVRQRRAR